jgi:uncharacterized protein (DUF924 family)
MSDPVEVLDFWLGELGPEGWYAGGERSTPSAVIASRSVAGRGGTAGWSIGSTAPWARWPYLIVTDQLPRNIHRGSAQPFSHRPAGPGRRPRRAAEGLGPGRAGTGTAVLLPALRTSEEIADQDRAVRPDGERLGQQPGHRCCMPARITRSSPLRPLSLSQRRPWRTSTPEEEDFCRRGLRRGGEPAAGGHSHSVQGPRRRLCCLGKIV